MNPSYRQISLYYYHIEENVHLKSAQMSSSSISCSLFFYEFCDDLCTFTHMSYIEHNTLGKCKSHWIMGVSCLCVQIWLSYDSEDKCYFWHKSQLSSAKGFYHNYLYELCHTLCDCCCWRLCMGKICRWNYSNWLSQVFTTPAFTCPLYLMQYLYPRSQDSTFVAPRIVH